MIIDADITSANTKPIRLLGQKLAVGFDKTIAYSSGWFTLDISILDGADLLAYNSDKPFNPASAYELTDYSAYTSHAHIERSCKLPYAMQSAVGDFKLINDDRAFSGAPFAYSSRPIRWWAGFAPLGSSSPSLVPLFEGFTEDAPKYSGDNEQTMELTALDMLTEIADQDLPHMLMSTEVTTDELIRQILVDELGVGDYLLDLDEGEVTIPFAWFEKGDNVGTALQKITQAENGRLYVDENGKICFRVDGLDEQTGAAVASFDASNIISANQGGADSVVNECHIEAEIREVQPRQVVYTAENENGYTNSADDDTMRIAANSTTKIWIDLEDPCTTLDTPLIRTARSDVASYFIAVDSTGTATTTGLTCTLTPFADTALLEVTNTNNSWRSIKMLRLWGTPARVVQTVDYTAKDPDSIEAFGRRRLSITDNSLWGTAENVRNYAKAIVRTRANYSSTLELEVRANILLQLGDVVEVTLPDWESAERYAVAGNDITVDDGIKQKLTLVATADEEGE